jgi:hypothetical protein
MQISDQETGPTPVALERHYSPGDMAERWGLSPDKVRELFVDEPGVLLIGEPSRRVGRALKRNYYTMRIPESVALRVHQRLTTRKRR